MNPDIRKSAHFLMEIEKAVVFVEFQSACNADGYDTERKFFDVLVAQHPLV